MSYAAVPRWTHGDHVLAADLNIISADIVELYTLADGVDAQFGVQGLGGRGGWQNYFVVHRFRWLWYRGEGYLELFTGTNRTSLSSPTAWAAALDLDSLGFLHYGDFYTIAGVSWALETLDA